MPPLLHTDEGIDHTGLSDFGRNIDVVLRTKEDCLTGPHRVFCDLYALGLKENVGGDVGVRKESVLGNAGRVPGAKADKGLGLGLAYVYGPSLLNSPGERGISGGEQHEFLAVNEDIVQRIGLCAGR